MALRAAIGAKDPPAEVAAQSKALASALLAAYPVPLAPTASPDLVRGAALSAQNCASCHGATGDGHGPGSVGLDPPPIAFSDQVRADQRRLRSEARRGGKEGVSTCISRWSPHHSQKNT